MRAKFIRRRQLAVVVVGALIALPSVFGSPSLAAPASSGGYGGDHGGGGGQCSSQAEAWGTNTLGQLGVGTVGAAEFRPTAVTVAGPHTVRSVSAGGLDRTSEALFTGRHVRSHGGTICEHRSYGGDVSRW